MEPQIPSEDELRAKIRELGKKLGVEDRPDNGPGAVEELWPGGPGVDTNDIRLARRKSRKQGRKGTGLA
jgi:hypothetical protein